MVWINKDTGVVPSKDGHTLFVDLVAEDEERERLAERSGLADPHGDMPDKEYLEAAVIIHDNGHAHGECYATDRHTGMVRFGRFELTDMELPLMGRIALKEALKKIEGTDLEKFLRQYNAI